MTRVLTPSELEDFTDPPPCNELRRQFGCEHFNCAGEPLLPENESKRGVPRQWHPSRKDYGVSRDDLVRLRRIECSEGEFRMADHDTADMRTLELMLLLNEAR